MSIRTLLFQLFFIDVFFNWVCWLWAFFHILNSALNCSWNSGDGGGLGTGGEWSPHLDAPPQTTHHIKRHTLQFTLSYNWLHLTVSCSRSSSIVSIPASNAWLRMMRDTSRLPDWKKKPSDCISASTNTQPTKEKQWMFSTVRHWMSKQWMFSRNAIAKVQRAHSVQGSPKHQHNSSPITCKTHVLYNFQAALFVSIQAGVQRHVWIILEY